MAALFLCVAHGQDSRPAPGKKTPVTFPAAARRFVEAVRKDAPERIKVEVEDITPHALGWEAAKATPAQKVTVWHPSGAHRALGLLPRKGTYRPRRGEWPQVVAVGPDLVVVSAPSDPVAMTMEELDRAQPDLERALSSLAAWGVGKPLAAEERPEALKAASAVARHPHCLMVDLPPGVDLDTDALAGLGVVLWRRVEKGKPPTPPTVVVAE